MAHMVGSIPSHGYNTIVTQTPLATTDLSRFTIPSNERTTQINAIAYCRRALRSLLSPPPMAMLLDAIIEMSIPCLGVA